VNIVGGRDELVKENQGQK